ncbi:MAG: YcnI family protein [Terrimesophilobacter sp.]
MNRIPAIVTASGAALLLALAVPAPASAHVNVSPNTASAGSYALVNITVPNESATAVTNKVELSLPTGTPFLSVSYVPVAGWTTELIRTTLPSPVKVGDNTITEAVTKVVWTAKPGREISAGQLQVFPLSLGPVPDTGSIVMPADQTYSDGTIVSWSETTSSAQHPAPVLYVDDVPAGDHHASATDTRGHSDTATADSSDTLARSLGIGGLIVGLIGIVVAVAALRRKATV